MSFGRSRRRLVTTLYESDSSASSSVARLDRLEDDLQHLQFQSPFQVRQTYAALLKLCGNAAALPQGRRVHSHLASAGLDRDGFFGDLLVQMYGKCGSLDEAIAAFESLPRRTIFSWNFIIAAFAKNRHGRKAIEVFKSMDAEGMKPDTATLSSVIGACASLKDLEEGRRIHGRIASGEFESGIAVETGLVKMYARCGELQSAREIFDRIENRDVICWNTMIAAYAQHGHPEQARRLHEEMEAKGLQASDSTFAGILGACSSIEDGKRIHSRIVAKGLASSTIVQNALVGMYARCQRLDVARAVFEKINPKTVVSWNAMIAACARQGEPERALDLLARMDLAPNEVTFASVFHACSSLDHRESASLGGISPALAAGRTIHDRIRGSHLEANVTVATAIVTMYGRCGEIDTAMEVFEKIQRKNAVSWNAMLGALAHNGRDALARELYHRMVAEEIERDEVSVMIALGVCASLRDLELGRELHDLSAARGFESNIRIQNALIGMYGKCGDLDVAARVFARVRDPDVVSWTTLIVAFAQRGRSGAALDLYKRMERDGIEPDNVTLTSVLSAISSERDLELGQVIHARFAARKKKKESKEDDREDDDDDLVIAALINMYVKCGRLDLSHELFLSRDEDSRSIVVWNAMITAYAREGYSRAALDLYDRMKQHGLDPDEATLSSALGACADLRELDRGESIHVEITALGETSIVAHNALLAMYASCGEIRLARRVFSAMEIRDVVSWTVMISGYAQAGRPRRSIALFRRMILDGIKPSEVTMLGLLGALAAMGALWETIVIHAATDFIFFADAAVQAAIVATYARCQRVDLARRVFDRAIREVGDSSANCWNAMMAAYSQLGSPRAAIELYWSMALRGIAPNEGTFAAALGACAAMGDLREGYKIHEQSSASASGYNLTLQTAIIHMYARCGMIDAAEHIFSELRDPDAVAWNAMLAAYAHNAHGWHAMELYKRMIAAESGVQPDAFTITIVLGVCASLRLLDHGKKIVDEALERDPDLARDPAIECAIFTLHAKCGKIERAAELFEAIEVKSAVCWHGIIAAHAHHGLGSETLWFYRRFLLQGFQPQEPSFLCVFLACAHAGLVDECRWYFQAMLEDGIAASFDHYVCVANVLSRAGRLADAEDLLREMPFQPGSAGWTSLLGACRTHGDLRRARRAADEAMEVEREDSAPYVLLSNIYAASGCLDHLRDRIRRQGGGELDFRDKLLL